jgi:hypothetical protein
MVGITVIDTSTQWIKSSRGSTRCRRRGTSLSAITRSVMPARRSSRTWPPTRGSRTILPCWAGGGARFYADVRPRTFSATELALLHELAAWAESELTRSAELTRAAEVQRGLLPRRRHALAGCELAGMCVPSRAVRTAGWSAPPAAAVQQAAVSLDDELQRTGTLAVDEVVRVVRRLGEPAAVIGHFAALADRPHLPDDVTIVVGRRLRTVS